VGSGSAVAFRLYNVAVHVLNTWLVARLLTAWFERHKLTTTTSNIAIGLGVSVFALHPMQSGAVAWISGGRDLTATAFGLGALLFLYREGRRSFIIATLLFVLGLLSK